MCSASCARRYTPPVVRFALAEEFKGLLVRRRRKRAIFALAYKLLKTVFVLTGRGDYYRDAGVDYEAMSVAPHAPRWMKMLSKYGYIPA